MKFHFNLLICIFLCLLSACGYEPEETIRIGDGGLLSGEPCSAPCFWNITPGITTEMEATDLIASKLDSKKCDKWDTRDDGGTRGILCSKINISFNDNSIVSGVGFSPSENIATVEIIDKYGSPDGLFVAVLGIEMQPPLKVLLYFDKEKMVIHLPEQNSDTYNVQAETLVERIVYLEESEYLFSKNGTQMWKGYGEYLSSTTQ